MTLRSLKIFIKVAELENMTKAADVLYTTQSSVSQVILDMEKEYNVVLFERLKNSLKLTEVGKEMLRYAYSIINSYDELENVLKHGSHNPRIRIGSSVSVGSTIIQNIVDELIHSIKNIKYSAFVGNTQMVEDGINKNEIDVGIVEGKIKSEDIVEIPLVEDPMVLICSPSHRLYGRETISMKELSNEPLIVREEGSGTRNQIMNEFTQLKLTPNVVWTCSNHEVVKQMVKQGFGISVMSYRIACDDIKKGSLWGCKISDANLSRTFRIVYHKDKYITTAMQKFIEIAQEKAPEL